MGTYNPWANLDPSTLLQLQLMQQAIPPDQRQRDSFSPLGPPVQPPIDPSDPRYNADLNKLATPGPSGPGGLPPTIPLDVLIKSGMVPDLASQSAASPGPVQRPPISLTPPQPPQPPTPANPSQGVTPSAVTPQALQVGAPRAGQGSDSTIPEPLTQAQLEQYITGLQPAIGAGIQGEMGQTLPRTPDEVQNSWNIYLDKLKVRDTAAQQVYQHHPSLAKKILAASMGAIAGMGNPMLGVAVGRGIYGSGPQQRALDIAETQLAEAKDRLSTALQMKNLEYTGMKTVAEARKAIAETGRVPYQNMKDLAEAGAASALEVGRRMELDPTWLKQKAGIQTDEDIRKAIATHIKTIDEVGLKSFLAPFEAAGIQPTTDQVAEYKRKMEAQHQITNAFEALYQGFRNTHGGMAPGQNKILEWAEKLKEPDQVRQLMIQERGKAQAYNAFEANFRVARKTANDNLQRINQTITALEQRSPAADRAGIESELGAISRRMGQSGVQYLTGGRTALESLIATLHHYSPWPWQPEIPDVQRTQILNLFNEYRNWERQQLDVLDEGGSRANAAANAQEVRNIQNETQRNLTEVLTGSGKGKNIHLEVGPDGKLHAIGQ